MTKRIYLTIVIFVFVFLIIIGFSINQGLVAEYKSGKDYSLVMTKIQEGLIERGYEIEKIQPIDQGMEKAGHKIDKYRVIFFNPKKQLDRIHQLDPRFSTLLPLSIAIAETKNKLKITHTPFIILQKNTKKPELLAEIKKWQKDSREIILNAL